MEIPLYSRLYSSDLTIRFPRDMCQMSFNSYLYTSTLTEERASKQEIDQVLKQFGDLLWKFYKKLILAIFLSALILVIIMTLFLKIFELIFGAYDRSHYILLVTFTCLCSQTMFFGCLYCGYRISAQKKAAFEDLTHLVNANFVGRNLKWQVILTPLEEKVVLWKGYMEHSNIIFGLAQELDSSFYMAGMTNGRISDEQVDQVIRTIKTAVELIEEKLRRRLKFLAPFAFAVIPIITIFVPPRPDGSNYWPEIFIFLIVFIASLFGFFFWFAFSRSNEIVATTNNLLEQFNPQFMARGFVWTTSFLASQFIRVHLCRCPARQERSEPRRILQTKAGAELSEFILEDNVAP